MALTAKAKRRLAFLFVVLLVISGGIAGLYTYQTSRRQQRYEDIRAQGLAAFEQQDYTTTLQKLSTYHTERSGSGDTLYAYARARLEIPTEDNRHLIEAMHAMERAVDLAPDHPEATYDLLDLYTRVGRNNSALDLSNKLLARDEQDVRALRAKATALARLENDNDALEAALAALELDPEHWETRMLALQLRAQQGAPPAELLEDATELHAQHEQDPRYELLLGYVHGVAGNQAQMLKWLRAAASRTPPDEAFIEMLVRFLDGANLYGEARRLFAEHVDQDNSPALYHEAMRRLFEGGDIELVTRRLADLDPAAEELSHGETALVAMRAMALYRLGRGDEADAIVTALSEQPNHPLASAWASMLTAVHRSEQSRSGRVLKAADDALATFPNHAFFLAFRATAYANVDEPDMALADWQRVAELRPVWSVPHTRQAAILLQRNEAQQALEHARAGLARRPDGIEAATVLAQALAQTFNPGNPAEVEQVLMLLERIRERAPLDETALRLHVFVLARAGKDDEAAQLVREVLDREEPVTRGTLTTLARLSNEYELGTAEAVEQRLAQEQTPTPDTILSRALELANADQAEQGLALIEQHLKQEEEDDAGPGWQLALAEYLARTDDPRAAEVWIELADAYPDNPTLQERALRIDALHDDRQFTQRAVRRLGDTLGRESLTWRTARARWLLTGPAAQRDPEQAASLLEQAVSQAPDRVEPRLLLAMAHEQRGLRPLAIRELRAAAEQRPDAIAIPLELARLHQSLRHFRNARQQLERVVQSSTATPAELRRAAVMFARQGEDRTALDVLESLESDDARLDTDDELLLAHLYRRTNQPERVAAICETLLAEPTAEAIRFAASFYASRGETEKAQAALAQRETLDIPEADKELLLSDHLATIGQVEEALSHYRRAVELAPERARLWHRLVAFHLSLGDRDAALAAANEARRHVPDNTALRVFTEHADVIAALNDDLAVTPILAALMGATEQRDAATATLRTLVAAQQRGDSLAAMARQTASLADQHPQFLPLQNLAARLYLAADRPAVAAQLATQAMNAFPTADEPAWLAARALLAAGEWRAARSAAEQWRYRAGDAALRADLLIAEADLRLDRADSAIRTLDPYLDQAKQQPDRYADVLMGYARGLIADGRVSDAADLLAPMLDDSPAWQARWMRLASLTVPDPATAATWLERITERLAPDRVDQRAALAQNWWLLATRTEEPSYHARAREIIDELVQRDDVSGTVWYQRGTMAEQMGDLAVAETSYREALQRDASLHMARNNLAMVLITKEQPQPTEAIEQARQAVEAVPTEANYLDTLAQTQARAGQCEQAIQTMQRVLRLQPDNEMWRQHLADILAACGQEDRAPELLEEVAGQ